MARFVLPLFFSPQQNTARQWPGLVPCESDGALWNWRETSGGAPRERLRDADVFHQFSPALQQVFTSLLQDLLAEAPHRDNKDRFAPHLLHILPPLLDSDVVHIYLSFFCCSYFFANFGKTFQQWKFAIEGFHGPAFHAEFGDCGRRWWERGWRRHTPGAVAPYSPFKANKWP